MTTDGATDGRLRRWLAATLALGLVLRLGAWALQAGVYWPDELFQYLEPATYRLHGHGALTWEFDHGVRNWIVPALQGAVLQLGEAFGLRGWALHRFVTLHEALLSLLLIPAGMRLGFAASRGSVQAAIGVGIGFAVFPGFLHLAPHTLSESRGLLALSWGYALWAEIVFLPEKNSSDRWRRALAVGLLLGAAVLTRYSLVLFLPPLLLGPRARALAWMGAGFAAMVALLGVVDWLTWGAPFHSAIGNLRPAGTNATFGASPSLYYVTDTMGRRQGGIVIVLLCAMLHQWRLQWRLMIGWAAPLLCFSLIAHKEDRYVLAIWPLFLAAGITAWVALGPRVRPRLAAALLAAALALSFYTTLRLPLRLSAGIFGAQSDVGARADSSGVLIDGRSWWAATGQPHLTGALVPWWHGGYTLLGRAIPLLEFRPALLSHTLFNYVVLGDPQNQALLAALPDWRLVQHCEGGVMLFRRRD